MIKLLWIILILCLSTSLSALAGLALYLAVAWLQKVLLHRDGAKVEAALKRKSAKQIIRKIFGFYVLGLAAVSIGVYHAFGLLDFAQPENLTLLVVLADLVYGYCKISKNKDKLEEKIRKLHQ